MVAEGERDILGGFASLLIALLLLLEFALWIKVVSRGLKTQAKIFEGGGEGWGANGKTLERHVPQQARRYKDLHLLSKTTRSPQFGGLRAEKELPRCFFLSYPLFFSRPFFFYLDHPGKGEQLSLGQGCCFRVRCRAFSRKSLPSYYALGPFHYCCHHLRSSSTFSIFGNRLFHMRCYCSHSPRRWSCSC